MINYFTDRHQQTKIDSVFSTTLKISLGVPQGSVLGPLLFLIFINDLAFLLNKIKFSNELFADDTTLYRSSNDLFSLISSIKRDFQYILEWVDSNQLILNFDKTNAMILTNKNIEKQNSIEI